MYIRVHVRICYRMCGMHTHARAGIHKRVTVERPVRCFSRATHTEMGARAPTHTRTETYRRDDAPIKSNDDDGYSKTLFTRAHDEWDPAYSATTRTTRGMSFCFFPLSFTCYFSLFFSLSRSRSGCLSLSTSSYRTRSLFCKNSRPPPCVVPLRLITDDPAPSRRHRRAPPLRSQRRASAIIRTTGIKRPRRTRDNASLAAQFYFANSASVN